MKIKTTKKEILKNYSKVIAVNYCAMQTLLKNKEPFAYTCGVYGWNADLYYIDGTIICTGYRPFGKEIDYKIVRKYEEKAKELKDSLFADILLEELLARI